MTAKLYLLIVFGFVGGFLIVEWLRGWRDFAKRSPMRDRKKPLERSEPLDDDGWPAPSVSGAEDIAAEASCGADAGGD